jgi:hypothetical protein
MFILVFTVDDYIFIYSYAISIFIKTKFIGNDMQISMSRAVIFQEFIYGIGYSCRKNYEWDLT